MKRKMFIILLIGMLMLFLLSSGVSAELSMNLQIRTEMNPDNKTVASQTYVDVAGNAMIASDKGYATVAYTYTTGDKVSKIEFLDLDGNLVNCVDGYAQKKIRYSAGNPAITEYLDDSGNPVIGPEGYARQEIQYLYGKHHTTWEYDVDGNPVNLHRITEFGDKDKPGLVTGDAWYDAEGNLASGPNGYARVLYEHRGTKVSRTAYYGADGEPYFYAKDGFAIKEYTYTNGRASGLNYYGADGKLIAGPDGYAHSETTYINGDANVRRIMYFNADGSPYFTAKGYCGVQRSYTSDGTVTDESYYVGENQRGYSTDGYSRVTKDYNRFGKLGIQTYYDDQDHLMVVESLGYARIRQLYNGNGILTKTEYYDENEKPMIGPEGAFTIGYTYVWKYLKEKAYYGTDGITLINGVDGYARIEYDRDENGKAISERYYDTDGNPFIFRDNMDEIRYEWVGGNKASESYWANGEPVVSDKGYHQIRFEYTGSNLVFSQTFLDLEGKPVTITDGYARLENMFNSHGKVMATLYYDENGKLINAPGKEYAYARTISLMDKDYLGEYEEGAGAEPDYESDEVEGKIEGEPEEADELDETDAITETEELEDTIYIEYYGTDRKLMNLSTGYAMIVRQVDEKGRMIEEAYFDADEQKVILADGYHSLKQVYGEDGFVASVSYFGIDGEPVINTKTKCHRIERIYQDKNHVTSEAWFGTEGEPVATGDTFVRIEREFDERGNAAVIRTYGADGEKIARKDGYDELRQKFNEENKVSRIEYYLGGNPFAMPTGYAALEREYDEKGNVNIERYFDTNGEKMLLADGYHSFVKVFNEDKLVASVSYYGLDGEPVINTKTKCHRLDRTYLDKNHYTSEAWFGTDGLPVSIGDTYVRIEREFDERGNVAIERYYGADGKTIAQKDGYDEIHRVYNDQNKASRMEYYLNGKPYVMPAGYAALEREYDEQCNVNIERYYDANQEKMLLADGYHFFIKVFNEDKLVESISYYGLDGEPVINTKTKYHRLDRTYLDKDHYTSEAWFDTENQPMTMGNTYSRIEREFDEQKNVAVERYYDGNGNPIARNEGYDEIRQTWNEQNKLSRIEYYLNGKLFVMPTGYAALEREYDEQGNVNIERYYDANQEKMLLADGYHSFIKVFNEEKIVASISYYGLDGEPVINTKTKYHRLDRTYLDKNHYTSEAWFDTENQPMTMGNTYSRVEREFDEQKNVAVERYYDGNGNPIARNEGYDEIRQTWNELNKLNRIEYYLDGKPFAMPVGYAALEREYDEHGNVNVERYYDESGEKLLLADGYHFWTKVFGEDGFAASQAYFGLDGEPVINTKTKYHRIDRTYWNKDHYTSEAWFGTDGEPITLGDTYVRIEREFDERGNAIVQRTYGADGELIARKDGYDEIRQVFNEKNKPIRMEYYLNGKSFLMSGGYAALEREYDDHGNITVERYFNEELEPAPCKQGYEVLLKEYNDQNQMIRESYTDHTGTPMPNTKGIYRITYDYAP